MLPPIEEVQHKDDELNSHQPFCEQLHPLHYNGPSKLCLTKVSIKQALPASLPTLCYLALLRKASNRGIQAKTSLSARRIIQPAGALSARRFGAGLSRTTFASTALRSITAQPLSTPAKYGLRYARGMHHPKER